MSKNIVPKDQIKDEIFEQILNYEYEKNNDADEKELMDEEIKTKVKGSSTSFYLKTLTDHKTLSKEEVINIYKEMEKHPKKKKELTNILVENNIKLVVSIAKKYQRHAPGLELEDLCQTGIFGLYKAVAMFDYTMGYNFATYAYSWIRTAIQRDVFNTGHTIRLPVHVAEKNMKIYKIEKQLEKKLMRQPEYEEVLSEINKDPELSEQNLRIYYNTQDPLSLDQPASSDVDCTVSLGDMITATDNVENIAIENARKDYILELIESCLDDRELDVIKYRFGFYGKVYTLQEVGKIYNISRERIRQIEGKALKKIRISLKKKGIVRYNAI